MAVRIQQHNVKYKCTNIFTEIYMYFFWSGQYWPVKFSEERACVVCTPRDMTQTRHPGQSVHGNEASEAR